MIFAINGMVRWKGQKLANGIDGKFETNSEKVITRLQTLGFEEWSVAENRRMLERQLVEEFIHSDNQVLEMVENEQPETNQSVVKEAEVKPKEAVKYNPYRRKQK
jgi:hypothetical protein